MNPIEKKARDIADIVAQNAATWTPQNTKELAASIVALWGGLIEPILRSVAIEVRRCKLCPAELAFVRHEGKGGSVIPYEVKTGLNHFITCPHAGKFRRRSGREDDKVPLLHEQAEHVDAGAIDRAEQQRLDGIPAGRMPG